MILNKGDTMKNLTQRIEGMLYREGEIRAQGIVDDAERIVQVSVSSELPVLRSSWFKAPWLEVLGHKRGEVDLSRLQKDYFWCIYLRNLPII